MPITPSKLSLGIPEPTNVNMTQFYQHEVESGHTVIIDCAIIGNKLSIIDIGVCEDTTQFIKIGSDFVAYLYKLSENNTVIFKINKPDGIVTYSMISSFAYDKVDKSYYLDTLGYAHIVKTNTIIDNWTGNTDSISATFD